MKCFPTKKNFKVTVGGITGWIYVKIDDNPRMGPEELYRKTGIDLRGLELYNESSKTNNLKLWKDLILKVSNEKMKKYPIIKEMEWV